MEGLTIIGYFIIVAVLLLLWGLIILFLIIFERFVFRRPLIIGFMRSGLLYGSLFLILLVPAVQGYIDDHPGEEFYRDQWIVFTGHVLPARANLVARDYGPPDMAGDYTIAMAFSLSGDDYVSVKTHFTSSPFRSGTFGSGQEEWNVLQDLGFQKQGDVVWFGSGDRNTFPTYHVGFHDEQQIILLSGFRSL
ncbi:MAG: hypothetical protein M3R08_04985 [Bacteroidota bacterium]|nr:hypothetical protein [Bacteroidota bacterium]